MTDSVVPTILTALVGRLEIKDVERVQAHLIEALQAPHGGGELCIDLAGVEALDTAGAQLLLAAKRDAARSGVKLEYRNESSEIRSLLGLLGLEDVILGRVQT